MILCFSHSADYYTIDLVMEYLQAKQVPALRINTELFPGDIQFRYRLSPEGAEQMFLSGVDFELDLQTVKAVWVRKIWGPKILDEIEEEYRNGVAAECRTARQLLFAYLDRVPCINHFLSSEQVENSKFLQLKMAQSVGLNIPPTIYTNSPEELNRFYQQCQANIIGKLHNALSFSMDGAGVSFYTMVIDEEQLQDMDMLEVSPMIFQARVSKAYELRVAYINGQCFAGKIPETNSSNSDDWRNNTGPIHWEAYTLPDVEQNKLRQLMEKLGLYFGAIDIIRNLEGEYVFLEVNSAGEWGMLQKELNYPIAEAIAQTLINFAGYE